MCGCHVPRLHEQRCVERSVRMCTLSRAWLSLSGTLPSGLGALPVRNGAEKERGNREKTPEPGPGGWVPSPQAAVKKPPGLGPGGVALPQRLVAA